MGRREGRKEELVCSSVTCILVRVRPKDVVLRLLRDLLGEEARGGEREAPPPPHGEEERWRRERGKRRRGEKKGEKERKKERRKKRRKEGRKEGTKEKIQKLVLNGVGVPTSGGVSFKNIPPNTPLVLVLSLPVCLPTTTNL